MRTQREVSHMVNKMKALERKRTVLRNRQNPSVIDYRQMRRARTLKSKYWSMRRKIARRSVPQILTTKRDTTKKESELEVIDE
ncbi:hypothetical protein EU537_01950 [Candidatus Thorarchaeota archaeon]|nr:MAG: hypothetical protein EU537_01950 [Candidatus Thorarchaeota archaeon]